MKSIWYFVGLVLLAMGAVVLAAGLVQLGAAPSTILGHLRPNLWWGAVMIAAGGVLYGAHRGKVHE
jgi:hypothetical protein